LPFDLVSSAPWSAAAPPTGDFAGYWALGRLLGEGAGTYDASTVLALQRSIGWREAYPNLVWYAPWSIPIVWLFSLLPFAWAWPLWLALQMGLVFYSADRLWRYHGGQPTQRWIPALLTVAFYPTLALAIWRQSSGLVLLGLVGFLLLGQRRRDLLAGACLALAAIKPQLLYLFWAGLLVWLVRTRRWQVVLGFALACALGTGVAALLNGPFLVAYCHHLVHRPPTGQIVPSLGGLLRLCCGARHYWLQFVPALLGVVWFARWLRARRHHAEIAGQMPALVLASILLGIFFWTPDLVVLAVCTMPLAVALTANGSRPLRRRYLALFVGITVVATVAHERLDDHWFYWLPVTYATLGWRAQAAMARPLPRPR
jgi:hypothetical protein